MSCGWMGSGRPSSRTSADSAPCVMIEPLFVREIAEGDGSMTRGIHHHAVPTGARVGMGEGTSSSGRRWMGDR